MKQRLHGMIVAACLTIGGLTQASAATLTIAQNAITRSDAIIKAPSNDPLTAVAIARTMIDMAPDHPLTRHLSVAYWKGGDAVVEDALYQPRNIEKLVAWGGLASITHIAKYVQPGIDLITLDPKLSSTIIGRQAFADEATMRTVAERLANDIGCNNQEGCVNARVIYVQTGTDAAGVANANRFGAMVYEAVQALHHLVELRAEPGAHLRGTRPGRVHLRPHGRHLALALEGALAGGGLKQHATE